MDHNESQELITVYRGVPSLSFTELLNDTTWHTRWIDGEEVVQVHFVPREVSRTDLDSYARAEGFSPIESGGFELDREPQFYLRKIAARHLPLTPAQRTRINLAVPYRRSLADVLSPQQSAWLADPRLQQSSGDETYRQDIR